MSNSDAESQQPGFIEVLRKSVSNLYRHYVKGEDVYSAGSTADQSNTDAFDCLVCGEIVIGYDVCYDCEQQYYPPRQYWQEVAA